MVPQRHEIEVDPEEVREYGYGQRRCPRCGAAYSGVDPEEYCTNLVDSRLRLGNGRYDCEEFPEECGAKLVLVEVD